MHVARRTIPLVVLSYLNALLKTHEAAPTDTSYKPTPYKVSNSEHSTVVHDLNQTLLALRLERLRPTFSPQNILHRMSLQDLVVRKSSKLHLQRVP